MSYILTVLGKLRRRREIRKGFKENTVNSLKPRPLAEQKILKYKTASTGQEFKAIHHTMINIVNKCTIKMVFDGELQKRELKHFDLTDLSEATKRHCYKFFDAIENSLPTNMLYYKDCYLIVTEEDVAFIKERFQQINYLIEDVELEDFKKFMNKVNDHENFYQTIVTAK